MEGKRLEFEEVPQSNGGYLCRAKVPGGWLVRLEVERTVVMPDGEVKSGWDWMPALTFVPDPCHAWELPS